MNPMGMLHGGVTATLVDSITTWCMFVSKDGRPGVTSDLSVSYLKGIDPKIHPIITLIGQVDQNGKTLAFCSCEIRSQDESILFATGKQTKMMINAPGPLTIQGLTLDDIESDEFKL